MTTKLTESTPPQLESQDSTPSPKANQRTARQRTAKQRAAKQGTVKKRAAKKVSRKPCRPAGVAAKRPVTLPVTLDEARREMLRLVCINSAAITQVLIDDALQGKYLSAKFLFETVGLCDRKGDDLEDATSRESLASMLLQRFQMVVPEGMEVTEVVEVTPDMDAEDEPTVESYEA